MFRGTPICWRPLAMMFAVCVLFAAVSAQARDVVHNTRASGQTVSTACCPTSDSTTTGTTRQDHQPRPRHDHHDFITSQTHTRGPIDHVTTNTLITSQTLCGRFEVRWLESGIDQHNRMLLLAKAESEQTTSTEIKALSDELITSLTLEMTQMQDWLEAWYGIDYTPRHVSRTAPGPIGLLNCNLDQVFIAQVIGYEHWTINAARFPASWACHPELIVFAEGMKAEGREVLELVLAWQALLQEIEMEHYYRDGGSTQPGWGG